MKKLLFLLLIFIGPAVQAQINITPIVGINSTRRFDDIGYFNGGNYLVAGVEAEGRLKSKTHKRFYVSLVAGLSYLSNGYFKSGGFSGAGTYLNYLTDHKTQFLQVPLEIKLNYQPFPLVEDWNVFIAAGISNDFLIKSRLREEYTYLQNFYSGASSPPPTTLHFEDSEDITEFAPKYSLFRRFEIGMRIKKFHLAYRISVSLTELYHQGLEDMWDVPAEHSKYMEEYRDLGMIKQKYVEIIVGYRIF